jgi:hypothetical protein
VHDTYADVQVVLTVSEGGIGIADLFGHLCIARLVRCRAGKIVGSSWTELAAATRDTISWDFDLVRPFNTLRNLRSYLSDVHGFLTAHKGKCPWETDGHESIPGPVSRLPRALLYDHDTFGRVVRMCRHVGPLGPLFHDEIASDDVFCTCVHDSATFGWLHTHAHAHTNVHWTTIDFGIVLCGPRTRQCVKVGNLDRRDVRISFLDRFVDVSHLTDSEGFVCA